VKDPELSERQRRIIDFVIANGQATRRDVQLLADVSQSAAASLLQTLVRAGVLVRTGRGPRTSYIIAPDMHAPLQDCFKAKGASGF
jgi:predicted HTH transcriptional regulator